MEEPFSFSPVDKTPAKAGNFLKRPVDKWGWRDFDNYFDAKYNEVIGTPPWTTLKQKAARKKIIEDSFNYWGRETFKVMVQWLFENYKSFPEWKEIHIGLVCGTHKWAKMIGAQAQKQIRLGKEM